VKNRRKAEALHYQTPALSFNLGSVADFVRLFQPGQVRYQKVLQAERTSLPNVLEVVVLDYFGG